MIREIQSAKYLTFKLTIFNLIFKFFLRNIRF